MELSDIEKYRAHMVEIKRRVALINISLATRPHEEFIPMAIESIGLQFRKVFELIAFATLAANRAQYCLVYKHFAENWQAGKLLKNLKRINPDFFPKSVTEHKSSLPGVVSTLSDREQDYLTQSELVEAHGRCGELLHAANPFGELINYALYLPNFRIWRTRIMNLLNIHRVHLLGDSGFYYFHMKEPGNHEVQYYRFEPRDETATATIYANQEIRPKE